MDYLKQFGEASKSKLRAMLANKWPEVFTEAQKETNCINSSRP